MIARHESSEPSVWSALSATLPPNTISWRQQGRPKAQQGGGFGAVFVAYIEANTVRERLDTVVPGEWDLTLDLLPAMAALPDGEANDTPVAFKARLQILGVIREDVGFGKDYKQASTDAFKRVAVRFGIGAELYDMGTVWVQVDGDGKYAKPTEDPAMAYARKHGGAVPARPQPAASAPLTTASPAPSSAPAASSATADEPCPKCGGRMWDNRLTKKNPKAPDFKCRDRSCDGVVWPAKEDPRAVPFRPGDEAPHPADDPDLLPF